jgi:cytochrome c-type biogenesis protein CcmH/NrfG/plastocyanin
MSARRLPASGQAAAENELLAQLGLPPSASPEDVDQTHVAVSDFLAAAPPSIRGWAHAQAAALDAAYLTLTDPVGLEGSALRSPTRPSAVVPGGPATPPARRDPVPATPPSPADDLEDPATGVEPDDEDLAALYASVTPSAHEDMGPDRRRRKKARRQAAAPVVAARPAGGNGWKKLALGGLGVALVVGIAFAGFALGGGGRTNPGIAENPAQASPATPTVDEARVAALMTQLQSDPENVDTLLALATEYYAVDEFDTAATWLDKVLEIDPNHLKALLARGAVSFNTGKDAEAESTWRKVLEIDPVNQEAYFDLGFMYFYQANPDYAAVQREWGKVIELDPTTPLAKNAQAHLDALVAKSMIPGASPGASPAASPAASPVAGASTAPTGTVLDQVAVNTQFSVRELKAPAGSPFTIRFENRDTVAHNIEIKDATGKTVFFGDLVKEPGTVEYKVPALAAGTYSFLCTVHPVMTGTLVVGS